MAKANLIFPCIDVPNWAIKEWFTLKKETSCTYFPKKNLPWMYLQIALEIFVDSLESIQEDWKKIGSMKRKKLVNTSFKVVWCFKKIFQFHSSAIKWILTCKL